jgi:putative RNA 2'-phosphotransferase
MISKDETTRISKLLSYVLRHNPDHLNIQLDDQGWTDVQALLQQLNAQKENIDFDILKQVVDTNSKKRFSFNEDLTRIRASQGHSVEVELGYTAQKPPATLFHGTTEKNVAIILEKGLAKMSRHHVHLSVDKETAQHVGQRYGKPIILTIQALAMHESGYPFYISDNGVWLTDHVPAEFIEI